LFFVLSDVKHTADTHKGAAQNKQISSLHETDHACQTGTWAAGIKVRQTQENNPTHKH
jgi:hypothetical protein